MSKTQDEPPHELENQFILRLPLEHASTVRKIVHSRSVAMKDKLKIDLSSDGRHAIVEVEEISLAAKLVDLPCVIGSLKTLDKKTFYKTADISQMLVCTPGAELQSSPEEPVTSTDLKAIRKSEKERQKKYIWKHGITPPLKNVRKKRFRKTTKKLIDFKQIEEISFPKYIESPDVEKEVKRLLCSDAEAVSARWEVIAEDETKEIESQGSIPGFAMSPGLSDYMQGHILSVMDIQKQIHYMERKLQEIQCKAQRQKDLIIKVENLTLKNHLQSMLEQLQLQEIQKNEQLISLREQLKYFLEK
uniref:transcription initiation factor TFIID subunit 7-like isoform X1 n=1 Tax=Nyctereutes procyonoides TaxID=34880 RepID=UPI0024452F10|nr:transcription initiation factor TFIID subunit 7-like isoform X1 [Nyctereutes procyonoides]